MNSTDADLRVNNVVSIYKSLEPAAIHIQNLFTYHTE